MPALLELSRVKDVVDLLGEVLWGKGFLNKCLIREGDDFGRHKQHAGMWAQSRHMFSQDSPVHLGHAHIGQQKVDRSPIMLADAQCFRCTTGLKDGIAVHQKNGRDEFPDHCLIIDEKNGLPL